MPLKTVSNSFKTYSLIFVLLAAAALFGGCDKVSTEPVDPMAKAYFSYFDTVSYVYSYAGDSAEQFEARSAEVSHILEKYHRLFDIYHEYDGVNNLCTINRLAGGEPVSVDRELVDLLLLAKELYEKTDGRMNVMMGSVLTLWHNCRDAAADNPQDARIPTQDELSAANEHTDISLLEIDEENLTVRISDPEASIDVGALGKGYATEMAAQYLYSQNADGYVLNVGGNIRVIGHKADGGDWLTGIRDPKNPDGGIAAETRIADTACVTSGNYERYFTVDGVRYHHIIDPDTLMPAQYFASITVITEDSALADAMSTALFCLPYEEGLRLAEKLNCEVIWIAQDGTVTATDGLEITVKDKQ